MSSRVNLSPFKLDIDELINQFVEERSTRFSDLKKIWHSRKFSYIYEASPPSHLAFFMQSLYAHTIGYMYDTASLSRGLGGLYCLYCLYETQPFKPPFKIYISLEELKRLKSLVAEAKWNEVKEAPAIVKRMLEKDAFLFGFVDIGEATKTVDKLTELQNARVKCATKKLLKDTRVEHFLHLDMGKELDVDQLKKASIEYADFKKHAIKEASKVVNVQDIQHLANDEELIGDEAAKIAESWKVQKDLYYKTTGLESPRAQLHQQDDDEDQNEGNSNEDDDDDEEYGRELERELESDDEEFE
ncbi:hypothetical protein LINGRAHAP2_LOCUS3157 [Linum grandiflorum]